MKKNWKFRFLAVLVMAIMTLAVACAPTKEESVDTKKEVTEDVQEPASGTDEQTKKEDTPKVEEPADTEDPGAEEEPTESEDPGTEAEPTESEDPGTVEEPAGGDEQAADVQTVKGTFGGLADPHTFELKTNAVPEGVMAFQFYDEEIGAKLDAMEEGKELTVVYKTNEYGQNLVESIE
ncbi:hypothetical protein R4Z09_27005 [Niallia oryzisoli]|uniref:Uncharacterized protein n=1 Tax=Niallia oryzisoli TaxID=1737571 RepID=A0ABZ2CFX4_9BACI